MAAHKGNCEIPKFLSSKAGYVIPALFSSVLCRNVLFVRQVCGCYEHPSRCTLHGINGWGYWVGNSIGKTNCAWEIVFGISPLIIHYC